MGVDDLNHPVLEGTVLDIIEPPQGGRVAFVAARVKNIDPCGVNLVGEVKDPISGQVKFEARNVLLKPDADGFATIREGQTADYANIGVCPNGWAAQNVFGNEFELTVRVESDRVAEASFKVALQCTDRTLVGDVAPGVVLEACLCTCDEDYILGDPCDGTEEP